MLRQWRWSWRIGCQKVLPHFRKYTMQELQVKRWRNLEGYRLQSPIRGIVSRDEYFFEGAYNYKVISGHALIVFTVYWWKNRTSSFSLLLWKNYLWKVTSFKDPKTAILTLKILTGSRLWFCKIIPEAACDILILAIFPAANERSALENIDQSRGREFWRGFQ